MVSSEQHDGGTAAREELDELVEALSSVDGRLGREVVADVVRRLEDLAAAPLGPTDHDALVLLQRRHARWPGWTARPRRPSSAA